MTSKEAFETWWNEEGLGSIITQREALLEAAELFDDYWHRKSLHRMAEEL